MEPLFNLTELNNKKNTDKLPFKCKQCNSIFEREVKWIKSNIKLNKNQFIYCGRLCLAQSCSKLVETTCGYCTTPVKRKFKEHKKSKSGKVFCNSSCAAKYNNTHKTKGYRRSKLEVWLEKELIIIYPFLEIDCNNKSVIKSELDFYFDLFNLAIELNGILHYKPIYGNKKLQQIIENDVYKTFACKNKGIELIILDISSMTRFSEKEGKKYLDKICNILDCKFSGLART